MKSETHIGLSYQENIPDQIIGDFLNEVADSELEVETHSRPIGVYASLEWAVPTLVIVYLAKPYFEGFLQEAGKDHYQLVKSGLLKLTARLFGNRPKTARSKVFSIQTVSLQQESIKFIFPEGVSPQVYSQIIDQLHTLMIENYSGRESSDLEMLLAEKPALSHGFYLEYSVESEKWILLDPMREVAKMREIQNRKATQKFDELE